MLDVTSSVKFFAPHCLDLLENLCYASHYSPHFFYKITLTCNTCLIVSHSHQIPNLEKATNTFCCLLFYHQHPEQLSTQWIQKLCDEMGKLYNEVFSKSDKFILLSPVFFSLLLTTFIEEKDLYFKVLRDFFFFLFLIQYRLVRIYNDVLVKCQI